VDALVHPILTVPISVLARWRGDTTLHAGAFLAGSVAWGIVGKREAGKSTLLATLGEAGCPIVADDLLTIDRGSAWSGPHCVDLRPDAARRFDSAREIGEVGGRMRFRLSTRPGPARAPLGGFFVLDWTEGTDVGLCPLTARERLQMLYSQEYIALLGPSDPERIIELSGLPAWRLTRPRAWEMSGVVVERLLETTAAHS
jgi:hypothetical protein